MVKITIIETKDISSGSQGWVGEAKIQELFSAVFHGQLFLAFFAAPILPTFPLVRYQSQIENQRFDQKTHNI